MTANVIFPCHIHDWHLSGVGSTTGQQSWVCHRCGATETRWPTASLPAGPAVSLGVKS